MRNMLWLVVSASSVGCEGMQALVDRQVMQSFLESGQDGANEQQAAEAGGQPIDNDGAPGGLTLGCVTITTDPSPLSSPPPPSFSVTWQFTDCPLGGGRRQSGVRTVAVAVDGTTGDRDFVGSRDITRVMFRGDVVDIDSNATMHATGTRAAGSITRTINGTEHRVRNRDNGDAVFDINLTLDNLQIADTFDGAGALTERVFNGFGAVDHNRANARSEHTATDVTVIRAQCSCPISGSIHQQVFKNGDLARERTYTFTGTCGEVETDDGDTLRLEVCG